MNSFPFRAAIWALFLLSTPQVCALAQSQQVIPNQLQEVGIDQKLDEQVPLDLQFLDESGDPVPLSQFFGRKPVLLTLVYYECPMLCTMVLNGVVRSLKAVNLDVGDDFEIVTVSINPREGADLASSKKEEYVREYGRPEAGKGWHFLTGREKEIRKLAAAVGFRYRYEEQTEQYAHAAAIMLLTPEGRVSRYFYGVDFPPRDLRLGLVEASANQIGTVSDQVLLFCYQYDALSGKYSFTIMNIVRAAAVLTILSLGLLLFVLLRRERREQREAGVSV